MVGAFNLKTPVRFYEYMPKDNPEPGEVEKRVIFECFANAYNPSSKDMETLSSKGIDVAKSITIQIRDTVGDYHPSNKHYFQLDAPYVSGESYQVQSVSVDLENRNYIKIIGTMCL